MIDIAPLAVGAGDLVPGQDAVTLGTVRLTPVFDMTRYSLRARDPDVLAGIIGRALPQRIGDTLHGIARLGPDEWHTLLPAGQSLPSGAGAAVSITDVSSRSTGIKLEGQGAEALLCSGCPLDLARMAPGRATRTLFETVEILLWRESETRFHVECWRSFAPWLWNALLASA